MKPSASSMEYNSYNMYAQVLTYLRRAINFELRFLDLVIFLLCKRQSWLDSHSGEQNSHVFSTYLEHVLVRSFRVSTLSINVFPF